MVYLNFFFVKLKLTLAICPIIFYHSIWDFKPANDLFVP